MNKEITEILVNMTQIYETELDDFAYKYDLDKVKEFEDVHYFDPIMERVVPKIAIEVKQNGHSLEDYLEFIKPRYHDIIRKEIDFYEKNQELKVLRESEIIEKYFMEVLLKYNTNPVKQDEEIERFMKEYKSFYEETAKTFPQMYFKVVANLRSPRIQYMLINSKKTRQYLFDYLDNLGQNQFDSILREYFMYPLEIELEIYYKKWIGKNKIHVKFCKNILGKKYEYAKKAVKLNEKGKWINEEEGDGLFKNID